MFPHLYNGGVLGIDQVDAVATWSISPPKTTPTTDNSKSLSHLGDSTADKSNGNTKEKESDGGVDNEEKEEEEKEEKGGWEKRLGEEDVKAFLIY
ncbi:hypothetical protein ONZ45_g19209 [Pleurotus djamor]|nr:hypothetical protein ONZ45_g19209 [Pleurotus djamor]